MVLDRRQDIHIPWNSLPVSHTSCKSYSSAYFILRSSDSPGLLRCRDTEPELDVRGVHGVPRGHQEGAGRAVWHGRRRWGMVGEQTCLSFHMSLHCTGLQRLCFHIWYLFFLRESNVLFSVSFLPLWLSLTGDTEEDGRIPGLFPGLDRVPVWVQQSAPRTLARLASGDNCRLAETTSVYVSSRADSDL